MKKILLFLTLALLVLALTACGSTGSTDTTTADTTQAPGTTTGDTTVTPTPSGKLTLAGKDIADYVIIYADSEYKNLDMQGTEYDFYRLTAEKIAVDIKTLTGVTLEVKPESTEKTALEILVGPTDREESAGVKNLDIYHFMSKMTGTKLVVGGGIHLFRYTANNYKYYTYASTYHAFDALYEDLLARLAKGDVDLADGDGKSGKKHFTTIACVGDSITQGTDPSAVNTHYTTYPAVLSRLLWQDCIVVNLGHSGMTMRSDLPDSYIGKDRYAAFLRMIDNVDLTLMMLGTNDSNRDRLWTEEDDAAYNEAAYKLCSTMKKRRPDMEIVVMNCPACYYGQGYGSARVRNLQAKLPEYLKSQGIDGVMRYDMHAYTAEHLGASRYPDKLHPNYEGYALMAKGLFAVINQMLDGSYTCEIELVKLPTGEAPTVKIPEGSVNIIGEAIKTTYPLKSSKDYNALTFNYWGPFVYQDLTLFEGYTVTNIEIPVASCEKGQTFTVYVVDQKTLDPHAALKKYVLTADFDCGVGYAAFGDLEIVVPKGYTLSFGEWNDEMPALYLLKDIDAYNFISFTGGNWTSRNHNDTTLAFNLYGYRTNGDTPITPPTTEKPVNPDIPVLPEGEIGNIIGGDLKTKYPLATSNLYATWTPTYYGPFYYADFDIFEGKTITRIEVPVDSCKVGDFISFFVVDQTTLNPHQPLSSHILKADKALTEKGYLVFDNFNIVVPEGYTVSFGSWEDTIRLQYLNTDVGKAYYFCAANNIVDKRAFGLVFDGYVTVN